MRSAFISTAIELNYSGDSHSQAQFPLTHPACDSAGATGFKSEGGKKKKNPTGFFSHDGILWRANCNVNNTRTYPAGLTSKRLKQLHTHTTTSLEQPTKVRVMQSNTRSTTSRLPTTDSIEHVTASAFHALFPLLPSSLSHWS